MALPVVFMAAVAGACGAGRVASAPKPESPGTSAGGAGTSAAAPGARAAAPGEATAATKATSPGGIKTVFMPSANSPLVALRVFFRVGSVDDPKGKEGLAALTADMVGKGGSRARTYAELLDALYPLAAAIRTYGDKESVVFEGLVHRDNLAAYADLLADQILTPRFAEDDFTRNRQDLVDYLANTLRGNADEELGKQAMATVLYQGHPYGYPSQGTVSGLRSVTLDDVRRFHATRYTRDRLIVGVAGGYPDGFAEAFARRFEALPAEGVPMPKLPAPPKRQALEVLIVEKETRANPISMGHALDITRADPDFYPLTVARSYLGEHRTFNGVLMNRLRGARGLNYGDYAYVESFIQDGWSTFPLANIPRRQQHFELWLRPVPPKNALFALRAALYETDRLLREGIPQDGLEATKAFLMGYSNLWTQDISRRLGYAIDAVVYGKDLVKELQERLPKITKADVDAAIRRHLHPGTLAIAIVADKAAEVRDTLSSGAPTPITYDTAGTPEKILQEDKVIQAFPLNIAKDRIRIVPVEKMFE